MLGVTVGAPRPSLTLTPEERAAGRRLLTQHGARPGAPLVAFVLSAGESSKEWPPGHFAVLGDDLRAGGIQVVMFEMPGDAAKAARLREGSQAPIGIAVPELRDFMAALAACDVLVSADTGPAHIATALRIPRVTIFGPEPPSAWAPTTDPFVVALRTDSARDVGIVPKTDPRAAMLTAEVTPAQVLAAVRTLLARRPRSGDGASGSEER